MNLFICNTPYQILTSYSIIQQFHKDEKNVFLCSNAMRNHESIINNMKGFNEAYEVLFKGAKETKLERFFNRFFFEKYLKKYNLGEFLDLKFNKIYFANLSNFNFILYKFFKKINKNLEMCVFEDGMISYSTHYSDVIFNSLTPWKKELKKLLFFHPNHIDWDTKSIQTIKINPIDKSNENIIKMLNKIFSYEKSTEYDGFKYIFFEEGFYADGKNVNDLEIVDFISKIVGKENVYIKTHPRSKINRFLPKGYICNDMNVTHPWELVCLNIDMRNKVLITLSSQSILTPTFLFGDEITGLMLFDILDDKSGINIDSANLLKKISINYSNICNINDLSELKRKLKELQNESN